MINQISEDSLKNINKLSEILKPVNSELLLLEDKLINSITSSNPLLDKITRYILDAGGKRLRPAICFLFAKALNNNIMSSSHMQVGIALELIHTATLIHDDVIDETKTRRGRKTVHQMWDNKTAIIAGDFLLAKALTNLALTKNTGVIEIFANTMNEICVGEMEQSLQNYNPVSIKEYIEKSKRKTAMLFIAAAQSAAILTDCEQRLKDGDDEPATVTPFNASNQAANNMITNAVKEYALNFGISFQIVDDILNFTSNEEYSGKPAGIDLKNGILTAPALFALEEYEEKGDFTLLKLIQNNFNDENSFNLAVELIFNTNGIQKAQDLARHYAGLANKSLDIIKDNPCKEALQKLLIFVQERKY
jgi:all-trans-nonaprenyl-diphosphate synthase